MFVINNRVHHELIDKWTLPNVVSLALSSLVLSHIRFVYVDNQLKKVLSHEPLVLLDESLNRHKTCVSLNLSDRSGQKALLLK